MARRSLQWNRIGRLLLVEFGTAAVVYRLRLLEDHAKALNEQGLQTDFGQEWEIGPLFTQVDSRYLIERYSSVASDREACEQILAEDQLERRFDYRFYLPTWTLSVLRQLAAHLSGEPRDEDERLEDGGTNRRPDGVSIGVDVCYFLNHLDESDAQDVDDEDESDVAVYRTAQPGELLLVLRPQRPVDDVFAFSRSMVDRLNEWSQGQS